MPESKPRRRPARAPQDHLPPQDGEQADAEQIDPELQALIDQENLNIQLVQQQALIGHLQSRVVALQKEILELKKGKGSK